MKYLKLRQLCFVAASAFICNSGFAQLSKGGIPLALQNGMDDQSTSIHTYDRPSFEKAVDKNEQEDLRKGISSPYSVALGIPVDISFPESGTFMTTADHHLIWRTTIQVDGIKALGLSYDTFQLPAGVNYFITNDNQHQVLGAYTHTNVTESKVFTHEPVQGYIAHIELDINPDVPLETIKMHINSAVAYFRGVEYLKDFGNTAAKPTDGNFDSLLLSTTSVCMIDANCPIAANYYNQKRATLSFIVRNDTVSNLYGMCSGVMVNSLGNVPGNCSNYFLTASHCDQLNSTAKERFQLMLLRYNYEQAVCNENAMVTSNTLVGCDFIARSNFDTVNYIIKGDFLLLKVREHIPLSWNVVLSGWNRDTVFHIM